MPGRLNFEPRYIVGNHGAEGCPGQSDLVSDHTDVAAWEQQILAGWSDLPPGTRMENKQHSLSLLPTVWRSIGTRPNGAISGLLMQLKPHPRVIGGKCVVNLLPMDAADKYDALYALQRTEGSINALFVGDDETDESVFSRARADWLTIRVGQSGDSAAGYYLNSQSEMVALIQRIDRLIRSEQQKAIEEHV